MKHMNRFIVAAVAILVCAGIVSCKEDGEIDQVTTFTGVEGLDMAALDSAGYTTGSFTVVAAGNWQVVSDKMWLTLSDAPEGEFFNDVKGLKGTHVVYVKVSNEAREFSETSADITLHADGKEYAVAHVVRPAKAYELNVLGEEGEKLDVVDIDGSATAWIRLEANFECAVVGYPEWLEEPVAEEGGYRFNVVEDAVPMAQNGELVISNSTATMTRNVPVVYSGMDPEAIRVESDYTPWGWIVSLDGKLFEKESSDINGESQKTVVENALDVNVICRDYACRFVCVDEADGVLTLCEGENAWIVAEQASDIRKKVTVNVKSFEVSSTKMERSGYLFALPEAAYEGFVTMLSSNVSADSLIDRYVNNVVVQVMQEDINGTIGCLITDSDGNIVSSVTEEGDYYEFLCSEYSVTDVTTCDVVPGETYDINTKMTTSGGAKACRLAEIDGEMLDKDEWGVTMALEGDGFYHVKITIPEVIPETIENPLVFRFYRGMNINVKALILRIKK